MIYDNDVDGPHYTGRFSAELILLLKIYACLVVFGVFAIWLALAVAKS